MVKIAGTLDRPTARLAYSDSGDGSVVVVLTHGAGMDRSMFEDQADALERRGIRVISWDLRGHGDSTFDHGARFTADDALADLDALLTHCGADAPLLVGHSLGGNLVQRFAQQHPDRVRGLIIMDSTWNTGPLTLAERVGLRLAAPALALVPATSLPGLMARASAVTDDAIRRTTEVFARMPKARFLDVWRATVSFVSPDPTSRSSVPLALVRGARDETGNIATAMPRWAAHEGVHEHVVADAGHIVTWDAPAASTDVLLQVLAEWNLIAKEEDDDA
ncbi:alpha/beta hydrolase [Microbacterium sp. LS_15]|uniref:alpha/beta fold hydrolase n=1 Tax=Microbacterium sp. LS_15 TaxID=3055790 RepID=UPI0035C21236